MMLSFAFLPLLAFCVSASSSSNRDNLNGVPSECKLNIPRRIYSSTLHTGLHGAEDIQAIMVECNRGLYDFTDENYTVRSVYSGRHQEDSLHMAVAMIWAALPSTGDYASHLDALTASLAVASDLKSLRTAISPLVQAIKNGSGIVSRMAAELQETILVVAGEKKTGGGFLGSWSFGGFLWSSNTSELMNRLLKEDLEVGRESDEAMRKALATIKETLINKGIEKGQLLPSNGSLKASSMTAEPEWFLELLKKNIQSAHPHDNIREVVAVAKERQDIAPDDVIDLLFDARLPSSILSSYLGDRRRDRSLIASKAGSLLSFPMFVDYFFGMKLTNSEVAATSTLSFTTINKALVDYFRGLAFANSHGAPDKDSQEILKNTSSGLKALDAVVGHSGIINELFQKLRHGEGSIPENFARIDIQEVAETQLAQHAKGGLVNLCEYHVLYRLIKGESIDASSFSDATPEVLAMVLGYLEPGEPETTQICTSSRNPISRAMCEFHGRRKLNSEHLWDSEIAAFCLEKKLPDYVAKLLREMLERSSLHHPSERATNPALTERLRQKPQSTPGHSTPSVQAMEQEQPTERLYPVPPPISEKDPDIEQWKRESSLQIEELRRQKHEAETLQRERIEAERLQREKQEVERIQKEKLEAERLHKQKLEAERLEREKIEAEQYQELLRRQNLVLAQQQKLEKQKELEVAEKRRQLLEQQAREKLAREREEAAKRELELQQERLRIERLRLEEERNRQHEKNVDWLRKMSEEASKKHEAAERERLLRLKQQREQKELEEAQLKEAEEQKRARLREEKRRQEEASLEAEKEKARNQSSSSVPMTIHLEDLHRPTLKAKRVIRAEDLGGPKDLTPWLNPFTKGRQISPIDATPEALQKTYQFAVEEFTNLKNKKRALSSVEKLKPRVDTAANPQERLDLINEIRKILAKNHPDFLE